MLRKRPACYALQRRQDALPRGHVRRAACPRMEQHQRQNNRHFEPQCNRRVPKSLLSVRESRDLHVRRTGAQFGFQKSRGMELDRRADWRCLEAY